MAKSSESPENIHEYAYRIIEVGKKEHPGKIIEATSRAEALGKLLKKYRRIGEAFDMVEGDSSLVAMVHTRRFSGLHRSEDDLWGAIIIWDIPEVSFQRRR